MIWKVAIVGCGNIAGGYDEKSEKEICQTHAKACQLRPDLELVAVSDPDKDRAKKFASRWSAQSFYESTGEMLEQSQPDIVAVCSPTRTHPEILQACLGSGNLRAILCEKPVGFDPAKLAPLVAQLESSGKTFAVNYIRAYCPGIQKHRRQLEQWGGCIGATVDYGRGIFNYGSHAIQWLTDWLGKIDRVEKGLVREEGLEGDPLVNARFLAGSTPVEMRAGPADRFDVEFKCRSGSLRFSDYAYACFCEKTHSKTGLESVMLDVYSNLTARLEGRPSRLVDGKEALAVLEICATLAAKN